MDIFEKATRKKLRFETAKGWVSVEDLWDTPLTHNKVTSLDDIAVNLDKEIKESGQGSFVKKKVSGASVLQLKFDVVKYVIDTLLIEADKKEKRLATKTKNDKIRAMITKKKEAEFEEESIEDLEDMLEDED